MYSCRHIAVNTGSLRLSGDQDTTKAGAKRPHTAMSADNVTTLLSAARQLEDIYTSQNVEDLDRLASGQVTLHKDSMMLMADVQGIDNLKKYYQVLAIIRNPASFI